MKQTEKRWGVRYLTGSMAWYLWPTRKAAEAWATPYLKDSVYRVTITWDDGQRRIFFGGIGHPERHSLDHLAGNEQGWRGLLTTGESK